MMTKILVFMDVFKRIDIHVYIIIGSQILLIMIVFSLLNWNK